MGGRDEIVVPRNRDVRQREVYIGQYLRARPFVLSADRPSGDHGRRIIERMVSVLCIGFWGLFFFPQYVVSLPAIHVDEEVFALVMNKWALSSMRGPVEKVLIKVNRDDSHCSNLITYSCVLQFQLFHAVTKSLRLNDPMNAGVCSKA